MSGLWQWQCQECGRRFKSTRAAERAAMDGCPTCGSVDIDMAAIKLERMPVDGEQLTEQPSFLAGVFPECVYEYYCDTCGRHSPPLDRRDSAGCPQCGWEEVRHEQS